MRADPASVARFVRRFLCAAALVLPLAPASPLHAAPCAGFTDVDDSSTFCKNVEWLKNRGITLGCTSQTLYCPAALVTRVAMALFLQRLGNAITPTTVAGYNTGSFLDIDPQPVLCPTGAQTPSFSRTAHGVGIVLAWAAAAASIDVTITPVVRENQAGPWTPTVGTPGSWSTTGNASQKATVVLFPPQSLTPGTAYQWGLRVSRTPGSAHAGDVAGWNCQIVIDVENRVTTASPYDDDE